MRYQSDKPEPPPKIFMSTIESSNIRALGYDKKTLTLRVQFKAATTCYDYKCVSRELFLEMMKNDSKGKFFWARIKNKFEYEKVEPNDINA